MSREGFILLMGEALAGIEDNDSYIDTIRKRGLPAEALFQFMAPFILECTEKLGMDPMSEDDQQTVTGAVMDLLLLHVLVGYEAGFARGTAVNPRVPG
jgi:hypothetical protein